LAEKRWVNVKIVIVIAIVVKTYMVIITMEIYAHVIIAHVKELTKKKKTMEMTFLMRMK
jgi:hypothetical protein